MAPMLPHPSYGRSLLVKNRYARGTSCDALQATLVGRYPSRVVSAGWSKLPYTTLQALSVFCSNHLHSKNQSNSLRANTQSPNRPFPPLSHQRIETTGTTHSLEHPHAQSPGRFFRPPKIVCIYLRNFQLGERHDTRMSLNVRCSIPHESIGRHTKPEPPLLPST